MADASHDRVRLNLKRSAYTLVVARESGAKSKRQRSGETLWRAPFRRWCRLRIATPSPRSLFIGDLAGGFPLGLSGLIMGTVVTCVVIAATSTFSPVIGGPDSPAGRSMTYQIGIVHREIATG